MTSAPKELHDTLDMMAPFLELARQTRWGVQITLFQDKNGCTSAEPRLTVGPTVAKSEKKPVN